MLSYKKEQGATPDRVVGLSTVYKKLLKKGLTVYEKRSKPIRKLFGNCKRFFFLAETW